MQFVDFVWYVCDVLGCELLLVDVGQLIWCIVWCIGGVQGYIDQVIVVGVDVYLIGEVFEQIVYSVWENGISFIVVGYYVIECYGVQVLGDYLGKCFVIEYLFIDCFNFV